MLPVITTTLGQSHSMLASYMMCFLNPQRHARPSVALKTPYKKRWWNGCADGKASRVNAWRAGLVAGRHYVVLHHRGHMFSMEQSTGWQRKWGRRKDLLSDKEQFKGGRRRREKKKGEAAMWMLNHNRSCLEIHRTFTRHLENGTTYCTSVKPS